MRGAFGKPQGTVARVSIGQPLLSIRTREQHREKAIEALRRAKFKFPGRQKVGWFPPYSFIVVGIMNHACHCDIKLLSPERTTVIHFYFGSVQFSVHGNFADSVRRKFR